MWWRTLPWVGLVCEGEGLRYLFKDGLDAHREEEGAEGVSLLYSLRTEDYVVCAEERGGLSQGFLGPRDKVRSP